METLFISKEALLEEVCRNRALSVSEMILRELEKAPSLTEKLNLLLSGILPLEGEKLSFLLMLLPVFSLPFPFGTLFHKICGTYYTKYNEFRNKLQAIFGTNFHACSADGLELVPNGVESCYSVCVNLPM